MTIYIAGPMSGLPELNHPAFNAAAQELRDIGFDVVNPVDICKDKSAKWSDCMRADIAALVECDSIVLLPGWENSRGAQLELSIAKALGMPVHWYHDLVALATEAA